MLGNLKWKEQDMNVHTLTISNHIQIRAGDINQERVSDFIEIFDDLPLMKVIHITGGNTFLHSYVLADGFHRQKAALRKSKEIIKCLVADGTYEDAEKVALEENTVIGPLTLSRADKRRAAEKAVKLYPNLSAPQIIKDVLHNICSHDLITKVRGGDTLSVTPTVKDSLGRDQPMFKPRPILEVSQDEKDDLQRLSSDSYKQIKIGKEDSSKIPSHIRHIDPHHVEAEWKFSDPIIWKVKGFMANSVDLLAGREFGVVISKNTESLQLRIFTRQGSDFFPTKAGISISKEDATKLRKELEELDKEMSA